MYNSNHIDKIASSIGRKHKEESYWHNRLSGELEKCSFPHDIKKTVVNDTQDETLRSTGQFKFKIVDQLFNRITKLSAGSLPRLHMILTAGIIATLYKYTGKEDIIVGAPIYKQKIDTEFINTILTLRNRITPHMTFKELLLQVRQTLTEAVENQNYPIEMILQKLNISYTPKDTFPLFNIAVLLENIHEKKYMQHIFLNIIFSFKKTDEHIEGMVDYNSIQYNRNDIEQITTHIHLLLDQVLLNSDQQLNQMHMLTDEEKKQLMIFCNTQALYPENKTIQGLFEDQLKQIPDHIAVDGLSLGKQPPIIPGEEDKINSLPQQHQITYRELVERSHRLALWLTQKGVIPDTIVGIIIERSIEMITGIFGIVKAGGTYLPIDPVYPQDRVNYMLSDSNAKQYLNREEIAQITTDDSYFKIQDLPHKKNFPHRHSQSKSLHNSIYVIYTSGSTGKPKGVIIENTSLVNRLNWMQKEYPLDNTDIIMQKTPFTFDVSVWEIFWWSVVGASVCLLEPGGEKDPSVIVRTIENKHITVIHFVPSMLSIFLDYLIDSSNEKKLSGLKQVIASGEALTISLVNTFNQLLYKSNGTRLANLYGPTEATIDVSYFNCSTGETPDKIPIGKPIDNIHLHIIGRDLNLLPLGVPGELCITGLGLARGYVNKPELTADKFCLQLPAAFYAKTTSKPHKNFLYPDSTTQRLNHSTIYRTGDLARWQSDGNIEYLGRMDFQVKIRGFRIELGEIESLLASCDGIKDAVVLVKETINKDKYLCAYVVVYKQLLSLNLEEYLSEFLSRVLPSFMVPQHFVLLESIPLTPNGKVDRHALPEPEFLQRGQYIAPTTDTQIALANIWSEALAREKIGIRDNFFQIGGDSITAIKLASSINKRFHTNLMVKYIYSGGTIEQLADIVDQAVGDDVHNEIIEAQREVEEFKKRVIGENPLPPEIEDIYPMSDIEKGMTFYTLKNSDIVMYHDQFVYQVKYPEFDIHLMKKALSLLVEKHGALRTAYNIEDFLEPVHLLYKTLHIDSQHFDISEMGKPQQEDYLKNFIEEDRRVPFNIAKTPLWRIRTFTLGQDRVCVLWIFHHAILDGWSVASLLTELNNTYLQLKMSSAYVPEKLSSTYKDYVIEQIADKNKKEVRYFWEKELEDYKRLDFSGLKSDHASPILKRVWHRYGNTMLQNLKNTAEIHQTTVKHLCLAAYVYMLNMISYENDIVVGLVTNNRPIREDGEKILGCFLNTIPARFKIPSAISWKDYIRLIDSQMVEMKNYERLSFFEILRVIGEKTQDRNPIFDTLFSFIDFHVYQQLLFEKEMPNPKNELAVEGYERTNTLFDFIVSTTGGNFTITTAYSNALISDLSVEKLCVYFENILKKMAKEPDQLINKNDIISWEDKQQILYDFNNTRAEYPTDQTIHRLFTNQVKKTPNRIALKGLMHSKVEISKHDHQFPAEQNNPRRKIQLSYRELNRKSDQIAYLLHNRNITPETIVGIISERSIEMIFGILGIVSAGGAYLPIDPLYPEDRIKYMITDGSARFLLTTPALAEKLEELSVSNCQLLMFDETPPILPKQNISMQQAKYTKNDGLTISDSESKSTSIAYVIYTSGSTGKPKGVLIEHRPLVNRLNWMQKKYRLEPDDTILQKTPFTFDVSVWEIFWWSLTGAKCCLLPPGGEKDPALIAECINRDRVTVMHFVPSMLGAFLESLNGNSKISQLNCLRQVIASGEALTVSHLNQFKKVFTQNGLETRLDNLYGPTEATIDVSYFSCPTAKEHLLEKIPIGRPIDNIRLYVLNKAFLLQPVGISGELGIAGDGLARGYLNRPELTLERFIQLKIHTYLHDYEQKLPLPNSFIDLHTYSKVYRTGDLARWQSDGNIEFLGRIDHQIKIRGFRIELGEIESRLLTHIDITKAFVIARHNENTDQHICAYIVASKEIPIKDLREYLLKTLPDYMIPTYFMFLEQIPLTANGKVNRQALPEPEIQGRRIYNTASTITEEKVMEIWSDLLKIDNSKISIDDSFFEVGGHSLNAVTLINRIHQQLHKKLSLRDIFNLQSIRKIALHIDRSGRDLYSPIKAVEKKEYYQCTAAEKRLYFIQVSTNSINYNMPKAIIVEGDLDIPKVEESIRLMIERHYIFRTAFEIVHNDLVQRIYEPDKVRFEMEFYEAKLDDAKRIVERFIRVFNLGHPPLLRAGIIKLGESKHILMMDMHHILSDGISEAVFFEEYIATYLDRQLPKKRLQYHDYSEWQSSQEQQLVVKKQEEFWLQELAGDLPRLELPLDYPRASIQLMAGSATFFELDSREIDTLRKLVVKEKTTPFIAIFAIYNIFLRILSGQEDILIGTFLGRRRHPDILRIIGMFTGTLVLRNYPQEEKGFLDFLGEVKERTLTAFENQEYEFDDLVQKLDVQKDLSRSPIFDVMYSFLNVDRTTDPLANVTVADLNLTPFTDYTHDATKFDIGLYCFDDNVNYRLSLEYCTNLFKPETIDKFIGYFKTVVKTVLENPAVKISAIEIISEEEKKLILFDFNNTDKEYHKDKTLHQLFAAQAEKTPDNISIIGPSIMRELQEPLKNTNDSFLHITYKKLNEMSHSLAYKLITKERRQDIIVGLMLKRTIEMMIGILGILKAGAAYLPIDPDYPEERKKHMLTDSSTRFLLTTSMLAKKTETSWDWEIPKNLDMIFLDTISSIPNPAIPYSPLPAVQPVHLAYIIYTSGSTGKPKGVLVEHRNVNAYLNAFYHEFPVNERDIALQQASCSFDVFVEEIYPILFRGGKITIAPKEIILEPDALFNFLLRYNISFISISPLLLNQINKMPHTGNIRIFISGGDVLKKEYVSRLSDRGLLYNTYGPTETTVCATYFKYSSRNYTNVPIGKPISNYTVYILNVSFKLLPIGLAGELCIGGEGVSRGYLNLPELSIEKFIPDIWNYPINREGKNHRFSRNDAEAQPPQEDTTANSLQCSRHTQSLTGFATGKIYRTGDLARWYLDGNIEFLGRIDTQIKIRGFRIELGEIENRLSMHPEIKEALVICKEHENGMKYLCAYIVTSESGTPAEKDLDKKLKNYLIKDLPEYMMPSFFIEVKKIPLTPNGKIDRKALPKPELKHGEGYIAPQTVIEKKLVELWAEVLNFKKDGISVNTNFFQIGGHSLNATVLVSKIHKILNVKIPLVEVFKIPTIRDMSNYIESTGLNQYTAIEPVEEKEYYPLSPAQKRLYILQQMVTDNTSYNMPYAITLKEDIDEDKLELVFKRLLERHESLRTSFITINEEPVQKISKKFEFSIRYNQASEADAEGIITNFTRPFDLSQAPLLRASLLTIGTSRRLLLLDMHHIVTDGTSHEILEKDFMALYADEKLVPLRLQYKDYSEWCTKVISKEALKQQAYWLTEFSGELPVLNLPTDFQRPAIQSVEGNIVNFYFNEQETAIIKSLLKEYNVTLYMCLLAVFNVLLSKLSGQEDIVIGTPIAARRHADLQEVVGMLVNTLAIRNYPSAEKKFKNFLKEVKQRTLDAYENQEFPFEDLVENLSINRDISRNPVFDVMFNLLNLMEQKRDALLPEEQDSYRHKKRTAKFDLNLGAAEKGERILFNLEYSTRLFKPETIDRIIGYFRNIVKSLAQNSELKISEIEIIGEKEKKEILTLSAGVEETTETDMTIHQFFEKQVEKTPDHPAVVEPNTGKYITYKEINDKADRLARTLTLRGVESNSIVGLIAERSGEMIVGILAVMKSGSAYLPIDDVYPAERKKYMLNDSGVKLVLVNKDLKDTEDYLPGNIQLVDLRCSQLYAIDTNNPITITRGSDMVYLLYTSGSTGKPKGVMLEHYNLVNLFLFQFKYTNLDCNKILQFSSLGFDVHFHEIFSALLSGGRVYPVSQETRTDIIVLFKLIVQYGISTVFWPISFIKVIFSEDDYLNLFPSSIRHIQTAGEQVVINDNLRKYLKKHKVYLHNHYGPAETHVVTTLTISPEEDIPELPSIGKPILNTYIYIVDKKNHLLPIGVAGELWIGGVQVGRGYYGKENLTKEKFIENPFRPGEKLYKSGDLARWLSNGNIEFIGRIDHQVKIRGYRVEMGEIEARLSNYPGIKETVVLARQEDNNNKYICAYLVTDKELSISELRDSLSKELPEFMIPSYFVTIEKMPLTPNGKIDRKALPKPEVKADLSYTAPRSLLEKKLVELWSEVLDIKTDVIGIDKNFFQMGGHSLKATILVSKIHKHLNVKIPLPELFKTPTIRGLAEYLNFTNINTFTAIQPVEVREYYPLSPAQKRLYILQQMGTDNTGYNMPYVIPLDENIEKDKLESVFKKLINRHESLRTSFITVNEEPVQKINKTVEFSLEYNRFTDAEAENIISNFSKPFDLNKAPLIRVSYITAGTKRRLLLLDMHHIITDGISQEVLKKEFMALYDQEQLSPLRLQYTDYAVWCNNSAQREAIKQQRIYWLKEFSGEIPVLEMPTDNQRPMEQSFEGNIVSFNFDTPETMVIKALAKNKGATLYMGILALFNILLSKLSNQEDIIIGTPIAARRHSDLHNVVGMMVNTLAMRNYPNSEKTFTDFLNEVKQRTLEAYENQEYPFEELVENLTVERDVSRNPIFDVMFNLLNLEDYKGNATHRSEPDSYRHIKSTSKFDLNLVASEMDDSIHLSFEYSTILFKPKTIERIIGYFKKIVKALASGPQLKLSEIDILPEEEKKQVLYEFNDTKTDYPREKSIHQLFTEQADSTPDRIAVAGTTGLETREKNHADEINQLTFRKLNNKSDELTNILTEKGVKSDTLVGLMTDPSLAMIIGILSILKAGGAYLPIETTYPQERIDFMLTDSNVDIILVVSEIHPFVRSNLKKKSPAIINISGPLSASTLNNTPKEFESSNKKLLSQTLAYVMYTSGTTGRPKGVMITHQNVVRLVKKTNYISFNENQGIMQTGSLSFDACTFEIWGALLNGLKLFLVLKETIITPTLLKSALIKWDITTIWMTSPLFNRMSQMEIEIFSKLKFLLVGGDVLSPLHIDRVKQKYPELTIINGYGPTENTTFSTTYRIEADTHGNIPIGQPISNSTAYILDSRNYYLLPIGVAGELVVGGDGVSRGYLNDPELTAEKFIKPTQPITHSTLYRTGDKARWLPEGNIEFLGRIDTQVKIRGFRIELGEIENQLLKYPTLKEAVVIDIESGDDKFLCAYISGNENELSLENLRKSLSKTLPDYMIPSHIVVLEKLPLNPNGKIDRKKLPGPQVKTIGDYAPPRTEVEKKLVELWSETLGIKKDIIGIDNTFFHLGGHSLKATILVSRVHKEMNVKIPLAELFKTPTIRGLAEYLHTNGIETYEAIEPVEEREYYPLSPAQKRLYVLQQMVTDNTGYNMPYMIHLGEDIEKDRLESVFNRLIARHESLRTSFITINEEPVQVIDKQANFSIRFEEVTETESSEIVSNFLKPFDLSKSPLLRGCIITIDLSRRILLLDMHHIITDGTSQEILKKEFMALYDKKKLSPLRLQYKDYAVWCTQTSQKETTRKQETYWLEELSPELPILNLPIDYQRPVEQNFEGNTVNFSFNIQETAIVKSITNKYGATLYMGLLAIFNILLSKLSGQEDIIIGIPIAARRHADLQSVIGMLVNTLAIRNYPYGEMTIESFLKEVKKRTLEAYENQEYPFEELVDRLMVERDISRNPVFDVVFNLLNLTDNQGEGETSETTEIEPYQHIKGTSKFDISLTASDRGKKIHFTIEYSTRLFKPTTIERTISYFKNIVKALAAGTGLKISEIEILPETEKKQILNEFNSRTGDYPVDKTIQQLFTEQVKSRADSIAVAGPGQLTVGRKNQKQEIEQLTYSELNMRADALSSVLTEKGAKFDSIVGLMVDRSLEMIVGILGILKAGAAYLPINPKNPSERIQYMLIDSNVNILISDKKEEQIKHFPTLILDIIQTVNGKTRKIKTNKTKAEQSFVPAKSQAACNPISQLAYIIYTSGSTGKPKGVPISHSNFSQLIHWGYSQLGLGAKDRVIQNLSYYFDWSVWEIFITLTTGAVLCIITEEILLNPEASVDFIMQNAITSLHMTPTQLQYLVNIGKVLPTLRYLFLGAEKLPISLVKQALNIVPEQCRLFNMYGPTEVTIISTVLEIQRKRIPDYLDFNSIPIGRPVGNLEIKIIDKFFNLCPIHVTGELAIEGDGVARGYLNNPELTADKFCIQLSAAYFAEKTSKPHKSFLNPYSTTQPLNRSTIYLTGDLSRWLSDGNIEFLGRIDQQIKIRGLRIELGEIENQLIKYNVIKSAIVIDNEIANDRHLCAYITPIKTESFDIENVRNFLSLSLPEYMIPSYFIEIDKLPLTANGKIDYKALPKPEVKTTRDYTPPRTRIEKKLIKLWSETLGIKEDTIGIDNNFFHLGGHSLKATILVSKIHKQLNVKMPLAELFKTPTIREFATYLHNTGIETYTAIEPIEEREYYPLSPAQKRIYILHQMGTDNTIYNMPYVIPLGEEIQKDKLESVFKELIVRHESLRTSFITVNEEPVQKINKTAEFSLKYNRVTEPEAEDIVSNFSRPFDLSKAPLIRISYLTAGASGRLLLLDMHHIITDGTSQEILKKDFMAIYTQEQLSPLRLQYKDYTVWCNKSDQREAIKQQKIYWMKEFSGELPVLDMPIDFQRPQEQNFQGNVVNFSFNIQETGIVKSLITEHGATLYMGLLAIFNILLSNLSGQEDIIIGTPIAARRHSDLHNVVGMMVNTLAMRNYPYSKKNFTDFLNEVKQRTLEAYENQEYPFEELVENLTVERDVSRNPVFDVMFNLLNLEDYKGNATNHTEPGSYRHIKSTSKFDLSLAALEMNDSIHLSFEYSTKLFKPETIERIIGCLKKILKALASRTRLKLSEIDILPEEEKKQVLYEFNNTSTDYPREKPVHRLLEGQVENTPEKIAIVGSGLPKIREKYPTTEIKQLTYRELNNKANELAHLLKNKGVTVDTIVGLMAERSIEMIIGIIGILKAKAAYLPIDSNYPQERIDFMLKDSGVKLLLLGQINLLDIGIPNEPVVNKQWSLVHFRDKERVIEDTICKSEREEEQNPVHAPGSLAYIIYTSGSTGRPKGVMVEHSSVVNLVCYQQHFFQIDGEDRIMQFSNLCFDASVEQIFIALCSGAQLVLVRDDILLDSEKFEHWLILHRVTHLHAVPSFLTQLKFKKSYPLKRIVAGGDTCPVNLAKEWNTYYHFINEYGPTETTVTSIQMKIEKLADSSNVLPIGKPIGNTRIYILDRDLKPVPIRVIGELFIGGMGVTRGYLNRPELTAEKFCCWHPKNKESAFEKKQFHHTPQPNRSEPNSSTHRLTDSTLYRTGDLTRWEPDGNIEFLGRIDTQVKIRGFRIELEEIKNQLLKYQPIKEAVVIDIETGNDKYLCAYICRDANELSLENLRKSLSQSLPEYMIPSYFIEIEKLPLTANGKIDRKALPRPEAKPTGNYTPPKTEIEKKLTKLWAQILGINDEIIGVDNNFFHIGGHSLKATILASKIRDLFSIQISLVEIFKTPTIRALAQHIHNAELKSSATECTNLVLLKAGNINTSNLFLIHDGTGEVDGYIEFCNQLNTDFNYWGIRSEGLKNLAPENFTLQELAAKYIKTIKKIQPNGPYAIAGWSLGGIIAFEMAIQLQSVDEKISYLALIDSPLPHKSLWKKATQFSLESELQFLIKHNLSSNLKEKLIKISDLNQFWSTFMEYLENSDHDPGIVNTLTSEYGLHSLPDLLKLDIRDSIGYLNLVRTLNNAIDLYTPARKLQGDIHYFAASQSKGSKKEHWEKYISGEITYHEIQGDHFSIFKTPHVSNLAKIFEKAINRSVLVAPYWKGNATTKRRSKKTKR